MTVVTTVDPTSGAVVADYPAFDGARIEAAITGTHAAATTVRTYWVVRGA